MKPGEKDRLGRPFGIKPKKCRECGEEFQPANGMQIYCSVDCRTKHDTLSLICEWCSDPFTFVKNGRPIRRFCSTACSTKATGKQRAARMTKPPVESICPVCGETFLRKRGKLTRHCSRKCAGLAARTKGPNHPRPAIKWGVKVKGEENCRNCGYPASHLHHIVPRSKTRLGHSDLRNGLPLCQGCHMGWHHNTVVIYLDRLTDEEREFAMEISSEWWVTHRYPPRPYDPDNLDGVSFAEQAQIVDDCGGISVALPPESRDRYLTNNRRD